jgi:nitrogen-specific signal transduction histidine kinase
MTLGELTASIAHEIKQPIATASNNVRGALKCLDKNPPDLAEVRATLTCIVDDTDRARDVIDRIGSLIKKTPSRREGVDVNAAILEVAALARSEAVRTGVTVGTQLAGDLPRIQCDRVQLQQVMLNLIVNAIQSMSGVLDHRTGLSPFLVGCAKEELASVRCLSTGSQASRFAVDAGRGTEVARGRG